MDEQIKPFSALPLTRDTIADLRSDHAGECGAVAIYSGILAVSGDPKVRRFAEHHRLTEVRHRDFFCRWLPREHHSRLLRLWTAAGWALGALSAVFGRRSVFRTIAAVETFVEDHYRAQIAGMAGTPEMQGLSRLLQGFCDEEIEHRRDASERLTAAPGAAAKAWSVIIGAGSAAGVAVARKF